MFTSLWVLFIIIIIRTVIVRFSLPPYISPIAISQLGQGIWPAKLKFKLKLAYTKHTRIETKPPIFHFNNMELLGIALQLAHLAPLETLTLPPTQEISTEQGLNDPQAIATFSSIKYLPSVNLKQEKRCGLLNVTI